MRDWVCGGGGVERQLPPLQKRDIGRVQICLGRGELGVGRACLLVGQGIQVTGQQIITEMMCKRLVKK